MNRTPLQILLVAAAVAALALHEPGHISMDTSLQLKEALQAQSLTWNPPFMSALLQFLGNGELATAAFVALCVALTYGSYSLVLSCQPRSLEPRSRWNEAVRTGMGAVLIGNPVVFLYVGIVWKDVLFASLLGFAFACALAASRQARAVSSILLALVAMACLVLAAHTRQQGLYLLPILLLAPLVALRAIAARFGVSTLRLVSATALLIVLGYSSVTRWTNARISRGEANDINFGLGLIVTYDILGMLRYGPDGMAEVKVSLPPEVSAAAVAAAYSPQRIDQIGRVPALRSAMRDMNPSQRFTVWRTLLLLHPVAYLNHRAATASWLLGMHGVERCLPVHVGVEGDVDALAAMRIAVTNGVRDDFLFKLSLLLRDTPWLRHYATVAMLALTLIGGWRQRRASGGQIVLIFAGGMAIFVGSMLFLTIACDFRYLYPVIPVVSVMLLSLLGMQAPSQTLTQR